MILNDEELDRFRRDGFVNLGQLFESAELEKIGAEYDRLVTSGVQVLGNAEDGVFPYRAMLYFRSPGLAAFVADSRLLELAVQLLGPDLRFYWDQGINKGPGAGREAAIRSLKSAGLEVTGVKDMTPVAHNGCRQRKRRRV